LGGVTTVGPDGWLLTAAGVELPRVAYTVMIATTPARNTIPLTQYSARCARGEEKKPVLGEVVDAMNGKRKVPEKFPDRGVPNLSFTTLFSRRS
jgi:hypothetical protein